ncbi:C4-dicarboxylate ABC transporter [Betaproteobacteria bacterium]|nr:C4-dicarboxylate ABC transporter [Betaproteobacteria bacterium]
MNKKLLGLLLGAALCFNAGAVLSAEYSIKVAYENNPGEPVDKAVNEWARLFAQKTGGKGELKLYPSSQLGSKKDVMEQMKLGSAVITIADGGFFADYVPDFGVLFGPYLGKDYTDIFKLAKTPWFAEMSGKLQEKGFHILTSNWLYGVRHMVTKKPVHTPADLAGLKIRVPNNRIQIDAMKTMGATPTPMPLAEVYPALTTGVIDGAENPIPVLYGQKHHEPAKYLILSGHLDNVSQWVTGEVYFKKLPPDIQKALTESADEAGDFMTGIIEQAEKEIIEKMKKEGVTVIEVDKNLFREAAKPTYTHFPEWTPGLYDKIQSYIK